MRAYRQDDGSLCYDDCCCIVRAFSTEADKDKNKFVDCVKYENGSGKIWYSHNGGIL